MSDPDPDWYDWHDRSQLEAGSHLVRRLAVGQNALAVTRGPAMLLQAAQSAASQDRE